MIRAATHHDASEAVDLVLIVLRDMELNIFNKLSEEKIKALLVQAFIEKPDYRYGCNNAIVKEVDGKVAGVVFGYPDHLEATIDDEFIEILLENGLSHDYRFFDEPEAFKNEWYLDTIVTSPEYRGQGIASELLSVLPDLAKEQGQTTIGLNVDKINESAKKVYLKNGYEKVGEIDIANHAYEHLQIECL